MSHSATGSGGGATKSMTTIRNNVEPKLSTQERQQLLRNFKSESSKSLLLSSSTSDNTPKLSAEERQQILQNFKSESSKSLLLSSSSKQLLRPSRSGSHLRTPSNPSDSSEPAFATLSSSVSSAGSKSASAEAKKAWANRHHKSHYSRNHSRRRNRSNSSLKRTADPSPLKFAAARARSRRGTLTPTNSGMQRQGSNRSVTSTCSILSTMSLPGTSPTATTASGQSNDTDDDRNTNTGAGNGGVSVDADCGPEEKLAAVEDSGSADDSRRCSWLSADDMQQRKVFLGQLLQAGLPLPRSELDYHAARVFIDVQNRSIYDVEQWTDYMQLSGRYNPDAQGNRGDNWRESRRIDTPPQKREKWKDTAACEVCQNKFWVLRGRHHCRSCDRCVCKGCSQQKFVLPGHYENKPVRVYVLSCLLYRCCCGFSFRLCIVLCGWLPLPANLKIAHVTTNIPTNEKIRGKLLYQSGHSYSLIFAPILLSRCGECYEELEENLIDETRYYIDLVRQLQRRIDSVTAHTNSDSK